MKKLILSLTIVSLLIFPLGAAALTQSQQESLPAMSTEEVHGNVPAQTDAAQAMTPAVHALVLAMTENHLDYDPSDSEFLWTSLYYMLSLYGQMDERAEFTDDTMILPSEMVRDYAAALYPDVAQLPEIPAPISQRIAYFASDDSYHLARGDEALIQVTVDDTQTQDNGQVILSGRMTALEDGSTLYTFQSTLSPRDTMFGFIIDSLTISA